MSYFSLIITVDLGGLEVPGATSFGYLNKSEGKRPIEDFRMPFPCIKSLLLIANPPD
jgi:hypothetical protein